MAKPLTEEERRRAARARFSRVGCSIQQFANELGVHPASVTELLAGRKKGVRGDSHRIAVALGLKEGVIVARGTPALEAMQTALATEEAA